MKIFITGSTGLLGSTLLRTSPKNYTLGASYNVNMLVPNVVCKYFHVDITKKKMVKEAITLFRPDIVIHTAAIATPDYCDKHQKKTEAVNVEGTKNVIESCKYVGAKFIYITTNGVYDGKTPPYDEQSIPKPIDVYGKTKYKSELLTQQAAIPYIIIRLITMYGWNNPKERQNPLTWQIKILGENKTPLNMVSDMFNNFLSAEEAAKAIWKSVKRDQWNESYNIAGADCVSRYEFSRMIAREFDMDESMIFPVTLDFFKNFVPRPKNTCFITKKMEKELKLKPLSMKEGLKYFKKHPLLSAAWKIIY